MLLKLGKTSPLVSTWTKETFWELAVTVLPLLIFVIVLWDTLIRIYIRVALWGCRMHYIIYLQQSDKTYSISYVTIFPCVGLEGRRTFQ